MYDHWQSFLDSRSWSQLLMPPVWAILSTKGSEQQELVEGGLKELGEKSCVEHIQYQPPQSFESPPNPLMKNLLRSLDT